MSMEIPTGYPHCKATLQVVTILGDIATRIVCLAIKIENQNLTWLPAIFILHYSYKMINYTPLLIIVPALG